MAYLIVGFAVGEAADIFLPALNLPGWTVTFVVALIVLGFPVALVLAWAFDVTPGGVVRTGSAHVAEGSGAAAAPPAPASEVGEDAGPDRAREVDDTDEGPHSDEDPGRSIAVLSFMDMSPEQDQGYFCDGIVEEIIDALTHVNGLEVAARSSAFAYKGGGHDLRRVAEELGVGVVLEGSVRKAGDTVRITAQLIKASNGYHLWSERYDRELEDIFAIQEEIAQSVVDRMRSALGEGAGAPVLRSHSADPEAYRLYLKGRHYWNQRYSVGLKKGLEYFQRALDRDPSYALAHAGAADAYTLQGFYSVMPAGDAQDQATASVRRALELDDTLAEAHHAWGLVQTWYTRDWSGAEASYRQAIALDSTAATSHAWLVQLYASQGRIDDMREATARALALEPRSVLVSAILAGAHMFGRRFQECIHIADLALEIDPDFLIALYAKGSGARRHGPLR